MYMCIHIYMYIYIYICVYIHICLYRYRYVYIHLNVCQSICINQSIHTYTFWHVYQWYMHTHFLSTATKTVAHGRQCQRQGLLIPSHSPPRNTLHVCLHTICIRVFTCYFTYVFTCQGVLQPPPPSPPKCMTEQTDWLIYTWLICMYSGSWIRNQRPDAVYAKAEGSLDERGDEWGEHSLATWTQYLYRSHVT